MDKNKIKPLTFKPDMDEAAKRWEAFRKGEMIDRPVVCVYSPLKGLSKAEWVDQQNMDFYDKCYGDLEKCIDKALRSAETIFYGGEALPVYYPSFGPGEVAVFCGAELAWSGGVEGNIPTTNWINQNQIAKPFVKKWKDILPLKLDKDNPFWKRCLEFYSLASKRLEGKMFLVPPDLHTNMDLLSAIRGAEKLCVDLIDEPEIIDEAMKDAREVFPIIWNSIREAGRFEELGNCDLMTSMFSFEGAAMLQCDFSCMISQDMFKKWVLPALEEEAAIVKNAIYHWDGPGALTHTDSLISSKGLYTLSFMPGAGNGNSINYLDLMKKVQHGGKAVQVFGSVDEVKYIHKELDPRKVIYTTYAKSQDEAERLLEWFVRNSQKK